MRHHTETGRRSHLFTTTTIGLLRTNSLMWGMILPGKSIASHTNRIRECFLKGIFSIISFGTEVAMIFLSTFPLKRNYTHK